MSRLSAILTGRVARIVTVIAALTAAAVALAEVLGVRYCQPIGHEPTTAVWAYQQAAADLDVVFIGSSRIHYGVIPTTVDACYRQATGRPIRSWCLGIEAGLVTVYQKVVRDVMTGPRAPKVLVVGLSPRAVNSNSGRNRLGLVYYSGPQDWWDEVRTEGPWRADGRAIATGVFGRPTALLQWGLVSAGYRAKDFRSIASLRGGAHAPLGPQERVEDLPGGLPPEKWDRLAGGRLKSARDELMVNFAIEGRADRALRDLVRVARSRGIRVVAVNVPTHPEFDTGYRPGEYETFMATMARTCGELGVAWLDLNVAPYRDPDRDLWRDLDHMNRRGALRMSERLGRDVLPRVMPDGPSRATP